MQNRSSTFQKFLVHNTPIDLFNKTNKVNFQAIPAVVIEKCKVDTIARLLNLNVRAKIRKD